MDSQQVKSFIDAMAASDLDEMEVSHDGWTLRLVRRARGSADVIPSSSSLVAPSQAGIQGGAREAPDSSVHGNDEVRIEAPMFGVVHLQQASGEPPFVKAGDLIEAGHLLCTIEAMKVFNEVRAERAGRVRTVLVASGVEVEAGQPLFGIEQVANV
jgi:acetyl-CoA carboxylase biotin carboxyl carrier protein